MPARPASRTSSGSLLESYRRKRTSRVRTSRRVDRTLGECRSRRPDAFRVVVRFGVLPSTAQPATSRAAAGEPGHATVRRASTSRTRASIARTSYHRIRRRNRHVPSPVLAPDCDSCCATWISLDFGCLPAVDPHPRTGRRRTRAEHPRPSHHPSRPVVRTGTLALGRAPRRRERTMRERRLLGFCCSLFNPTSLSRKTGPDAYHVGGASRGADVTRERGGEARTTSETWWSSGGSTPFWTRTT